MMKSVMLMYRPLELADTLALSVGLPKRYHSGVDIVRWWTRLPTVVFNQAIAAAGIVIDLVNAARCSES